ncbi:hypothetical protein ONZ45_g13917 [Pleurotus djamor]|nr:hypothetical protein ONZ45_g13917 [Pleurotus djamor]
MSEPALCLGLPYDPAAQEVYRRLCTCIPLSHVTEVTFSQFHPLEEEWSEFFSALVNLETLSLEDASDFWLPRFLSSPTVATALKVIVYKLTSLPISEDSVCCMDIHTAEELNAALDHRTPSKGNHDLSRLQFLRQRRDAGIPLQKLIVNQCYISRRYIDLLRLYVDVDWDGIQDVDDMDDGCLRPFSLFSEKFSFSISAFDQRVD